jgi:Tfp pilus assembly protein PilV
MKRLNNRGDTIVEVMISLAVLGMVIGVSYGTATRSLRGMRMAQERSEALKLAESKVESIRATDGANYADCMTGDSVAGSFCRKGSIYTYQTTQTNGIYKVTVNWDRVGGGSQETLSLVYRLN